MDYYEDDEKFGDYFDDQPDSGEGYFSGGDDYKDDSEPDWFQDLREEFEAKERVGGTIGCWSIGKDGRPLKVQTPLGRFCLHVDAVARHLKGKWQGMKESDIQTLLEVSQRLPRVGYKNATAFVLGYIASHGGQRQITKLSLEKAFRYYKLMSTEKKDLSIKKPDIIRYARLWVDLVSSK